MSFAVSVTGRFKRQAKRLIKKYTSLADELEDLIASLEANPQQGASLGNGLYKIRLSIRSKGKGKSGGARVITCVFSIEHTVYLLAIYDKSEFDTLSDARLIALLDGLKGE